MLVHEACKSLSIRLMQTTADDSLPRAALDLAAAAGLAAAPAIAWFARAEMSQALGLAALCALGVHTLLQARSLDRAALACAPALAAGISFLADSASSSAFAATAAGACMLYILSAAYDAARRSAHEAAQNAELLRQMNMTHGAQTIAEWEIDFARQQLVGEDRLARVLGRKVSYHDVVDGACFAAPEDQAIVREALAPPPGNMRRLALEHDVVRQDGSRTRVRHQGVLRTSPDGAAARLTCTTRPSAQASSAANDDAPPSALAVIEKVLKAQAHTLLVIGNELPDRERGASSEKSALAPTDYAGRLADNLDVLEQQRAAIANSINDFVRAHHEAQAANVAKSQFLASMSHELRTPLNAIIGYAEMLQEDAEDAGDKSATQDLARILTAARHLLSLINEILDLSKIEAGRMDVTASAFDMPELLGDLIDTVRPLAEQNANELVLKCAGPAATANTDATKFRQCVLNLLSNACKFTQNGKIDVTAEQRYIHGVEQIFVTVADTGIGISPEQMSLLFQPFVQADPSITRKYGGTGLGLTITRRLAQLLGGDVSVTSTQGEGATFTLHIPADFADASAALGAAAHVDPPQGAADAPLVVVIEDEADARELAARALTRAGFAVQGVGGGEAGLALARSKAPVLVLLDIFLPDRSGWRVLQSLKQDPKTRDIPVIVLSVNEDRGHALALGAAEHIVKPADRDVLAATVMRYARNRTAIAAPAAASPTAQKQAG